MQAVWIRLLLDECLCLSRRRVIALAGLSSQPVFPPCDRPVGCLFLHAFPSFSTVRSVFPALQALCLSVIELLLCQRTGSSLVRYEEVISLIVGVKKGC